MIDPILQSLADGIKTSTVATCARVAELHQIKSHTLNAADALYRNGYNQAVADIAAKIRELKSKERA